jgi:Uncharacterised protein family (UPF0149).
MMDLADIEQINAWLDRLRTDGRNFDYVHGFMTGLVCAFSDDEELIETIALISVLDDPEHASLPVGIDKDDMLECLDALSDDIDRDIADHAYRPYMGGRYVNRIRHDTPCSQWCRGFAQTSLAYAEEIRDDEGLMMALIPMLVLAEADDTEGLLGDLDPSERPGAVLRARSELIDSVYTINAMRSRG